MADGFQLAIESSSTRASIALSRGRDLVIATAVEAGRRPSEILIQPLQEALSHIDENRLEVVLIGTGPGSYNGARVAIAAGQGVALVHECPVIGISSLEAISPISSS